eukprot:510889_1
MALLRSLRSSINTYRTLSHTNTHQLLKPSQHIRFFTSFTTTTTTTSTTNNISPLPMTCKRLYNQQFTSPYQFVHPLYYQNQNPIEVHSTTIICVRKDNEVVMVGDGQMTIGTVVAKPNGRKLRKLNNEKSICGFAGAAADGIALVDLLEKKLSERDELRRACVETSRMWRTDKILRHLNAILMVADEKATYQLTGTGELVESDTGIMAIGSGGNFAEAAARALMDRDDLSADSIAAKAMQIAGDMCIYTNHNTMKLRLIKGE